MDQCEYHTDMKESINKLYSITQGTITNQGAEEVHRKTMYGFLTDLQKSQGDIKESLKSMEVGLHRDFATQQDLQELERGLDEVRRDSNANLWKAIGAAIGIMVLLASIYQWVISFLGGI